MVHETNARKINLWAIAFVVAVSMGMISTAYYFIQAKMNYEASVIVTAYTLDIIDYADAIQDRLDLCIAVNKANEEIYGMFDYEEAD